MSADSPTDSTTPAPLIAIVALVVACTAGNEATWICLVNPPPDSIPHVMKGMAHSFVVRANGATAASRTAPESGVIRLVDYRFSLSAPLTAGRHMIRVENMGAEPHEVGFLLRGRPHARRLRVLLPCNSAGRSAADRARDDPAHPHRLTAWAQMRMAGFERARADPAATVRQTEANLGRPLTPAEPAAVDEYLSRPARLPPQSPT